MKKLIFLCTLFMTWGFEASSHQFDREAAPQYAFMTNDDQSGLTDSDVHFLYTIFDEFYKSAISNKSKSWTAGYDWEKQYLGAGSTFSEGNYGIMLWGGLVRARGMNFGALSAVICHELGHKLGGEPFQKFPGLDPDWSSAEGQADYFAATICLPRLYDKLLADFPKQLRRTDLEDFSISLCQNSKNTERCRWVAQAGVDLIEVLQIYYNRDEPAAQIDQWSKQIVSATLFTAYPTAQCRMDIYKAAASEPERERLPCWFR